MRFKNFCRQKSAPVTAQPLGEWEKSVQSIKVKDIMSIENHMNCKRALGVICHKSHIKIKCNVNKRMEKNAVLFLTRMSRD